MRYLLLLSILILCDVHASHISWQKDYETARKKAFNENKNILVFLIEKNTPKINRIIQNSFINKEYIETIKKKFIAVIVQREALNSYPVELLYTTEFPALFFLSTDELFLCDSLQGIITPYELRKKLLECQ